ncbi:MAG: [FeFe] hydrogenase H-cluster radical SAM maturase HydE [Ignavibacteriaceae bacterium]|nr:[FeFe] hydrogenase H-cluster radical SAM maturase HydE [Ignavibacteriaceae bacterium]
MFSYKNLAQNIDLILGKENHTKEDIVFLLSLEDPFDVKLLYQRADEVRKKYCGDEVHLRGIIEFSNYCDQHCLYCGLRLQNTELERYRMTKEAIISAAYNIYVSGIRTIVLQSGEDHRFDCADIEEIITTIKKDLDVAITLSLGEREFNEYKRWKDAGADRYLLKHETANQKLYSVYHQGDELDERIEHIKYLKSIGFQVGSGNIIGLPQQTIEDIANDILLLKEVDVDMCSISPFVPSQNTPYREEENGDINLVLKAMAVTRIVLKNSHIPATTALATLDTYGRKKGLKAGANVIMPNFTPQPYKGKYIIYENKARTASNPKSFVKQLRKLIESLGRKVGTTKGHSLKEKETRDFYSIKI